MESHYPGFTGTYILGSVQGEIKDLDMDKMLEANVPTSDGACLHSISTLMNHKPKKQANVQYKYCTCVLMSRHDVIQEHALRALRNIRAGEELFAYYGPHYVISGPTAGTYET